MKSETVHLESTPNRIPSSQLQGREAQALTQICHTYTALEWRWLQV